MKQPGIFLVVLVNLLISAFSKGKAEIFVYGDLRPADTLRLADPTIFLDKGTYYLYGTSSDRGFLVYQSRDLQNWEGPVGRKEGFALSKGDSYGTKGFWAPQVFKFSGKYYMAYTADEHIAIASSDSPLGPFKQDNKRAISGSGKQIDPYVFRDKDGRFYLYHVRLTHGNRIFVAAMKPDLSDIDSATSKEIITATQPWENTAHTDWPVTEGPTVLFHGGLYYLFYSANDFRNIDYAVGYAVSKNPFGPWEKFAGNPVISRQNIHHNGTGHGDFFIDKSGALLYVFHVHKSDSVVSPRLTAIVDAKFDKTHGQVDSLKINPLTFRFLLLEK